MRLRTLSLATCLVALLAALGSTSAFAQDGEMVPADSTFYLRGSGCGATEQFWLSNESGTDEYDGCGIIGGLPLNEVIHQVDGPTPNAFTTREEGEEDGIPVVLDASRNVTGTIRAESWLGDGIPGVGQVIVEVDLFGVTATGDSVAIGSASVESMNTGADSANAAFTIDVPDAANLAELVELTLNVEVHGVNWNSGNLGLSGDSKFTLPTLVPAEVPAA